MRNTDKQFILQNDEFDLQQLIFRFKQYRWLFIGCIVLSIGVSYFYTLHSIPVYSVKASVLIDEEEDMSKTAELIYGNELLSGDKSLHNEIAILKSYPFIYRTVQEINPRVSIYEESLLGGRELYKSSPFTVILDTLQHNPANEGIPMQVRILNAKEFQLHVDWQQANHPELEIDKKLAFGEAFILNGSSLQLELKQLPADATDHAYSLILNNLKQVARKYKDRLTVRPYSQDASVIDISLETNVPNKEIDFLNELVRQYHIFSLEDKNLSTTQSLTFIDEQLVRTHDTLQVIERTLESFKSRNNFSEASSMAERSFDRISELETEKANVVVNGRYYQSLLQYMQEDRNLDQLMAPSAVGIQDILLNDLISQLVSLQIDKNAYLVKGSAKNPFVLSIDGKIENIKKTLTESLQNLITSNKVLLAQLNERIAYMERTVSSLPEAERRYINIRRLYDLNESVYTLLLQKKVEAGIAQASATVDSKIIEPAYLTSSIPIKPRKMRIMLMALALGLLLPTAFIFAREQLSTKVKRKSDISRYTNVPIFDTIGKNDENCSLIVHEEPRHSVSESFRSLRSNLKFTIGQKEGCQVYLLTSTLSGEGKTFCSTNLAIALAQAGKKTLLLDADLRKEHSLQGFKLNRKQKGLSNYLIQDATLDEVIYQTQVSNLEVMPSGTIPPNPAELLLTDAIEVMMDVLRSSYNYIVIDTAPLGLVTDAQALMRFSSSNFHLVRQNFTEKEAVKRIDEMYEQKTVKNLNILYNDVKAGSEYGYAYRYSYYEQKQKPKGIMAKLKVFFL